MCLIRRKEERGTKDRTAISRLYLGKIKVEVFAGCVNHVFDRNREEKTLYIKR